MSACLLVLFLVALSIAEANSASGLFTVTVLVALSVSEAISVNGPSTDAVFGDLICGGGCFCE